MRGIYYSLVVLVLYGDLLKRVMKPEKSLAILYALAVLILIASAIVNRRRVRVPVSKEGQLIYKLVLLLVLLYLTQTLTSLSNPLSEVIAHAFYICVPLLYIVVILRYCPQFDLLRFAKIFLMLMVPVNCIGLIQYYINPTFFISTAYSGELGGTIIRNLLGEGVFIRYPSLFVSADRYSAIGLMQVYFTIILFKGQAPYSRLGQLWLAFNLAGGFAAMFIAGARSRILITSIAFIFMAITFILGGILSQKFQRARRRIKRMFPLLVGGVVIVAIALARMSEGQLQEEESFSVFTLFKQSFEEGDIGRRVKETLILSLMPEEITMFGQGLGSIGGGKPGEIGIMSMWIESGYLWGTFMLLAFLGIVSALSLKVWKSFLALESLNVLIYTIPTLLLILALLFGLTSVFELSSGLLVCCVIAVISRSSANITGGGRLPLRIES